MQDLLDTSILGTLDERAEALEQELNSDIVFYHGAIHPAFFRNFRNAIEEIKKNSTKNNDAISVVLRTGGGSAETTERMVSVLRKHYKFVYFIVPDIAMSAGTILCMSGDKIYMDYASSLGPIDPQVPAPDTGGLVPALGYIDKVSEILEKEELLPADVVVLKSVDIARLALFQQAKDLSIDLLKNWLVEYKFKDWNKHRTNNPGEKVTMEEKQQRAEEIARDLSDHKKWRSHGRNLDIQKLNALRIEIDDYSDNANLRSLIRDYNDLLTGYLDRQDLNFFLHSPHIKSNR